jgi:signal transduction histidine kinase
MSSPRNTSLYGHQQSFQRIDIRTLWAWVGSQAAVGFPLIIFLAIYPVFIGWFQPPTAELAISINYHLFDLLSGVGTATAVLLLRFAVKPLGQGTLRTSVIALGWFIAGYLGSLLQYSVAKSAGPISPIYEELLPIGGLSFWTLSFCFTVLARVIGQNRQTSQELAQAKNRLDFLQSTVAQQVADAQQQLQRDVQEKISPVIESLSAEVEQLTQSHSDDSRSVATGQLRAAALDLIRPLSHELYTADAEVQFESSPNQRAGRTRVTIREVLTRKMNVNVVFNPALPAILILAFFSASYYIVAGWMGVLEGCIATTAVVVAALAGMNRLTRGRQLNAVVVLLIGVVTSLLLAGLYVVIPEALNVGIQADYQVFLAVGSALVLLGTTIVFFLFDNRMFALSRTKEANDENASLVARSRQEVWLRQKQIAKIVHGNVQSRLNAARIRLTQATTITPELVESVLSDLESAQQELSRPPAESATDIQGQLTELADFWRGVCTFTFTADQNSQETLTADTSAAQAVMEVVSEGVSNAVKHSHAQQLHLTIAQASPVSVKVELKHAVEESSVVSTSTGLGTQILNQLTLNWSFSQDKGTALLQAEIPTARQAQ